MKKFTTIALAGAIALGGLGVANLATPQTTAHAAVIQEILADYSSYSPLTFDYFDVFTDAAPGNISSVIHVKDNNGYTYTAGAKVALVIQQINAVRVRTSVDYVSNANGYAYPSITVKNIAPGTYYVLTQVIQPDGSTKLYNKQTLTIN